MLLTRRKKTTVGRLPAVQRFDGSAAMHMKTLATLSLLQTVALIVVIASLSGHSPQTTLESPRAPHPTISEPPVDASAVSRDEQRLLDLIREELARAPRMSSKRNEAEASVQVSARDEAADQSPRKFVGQQIEM